MSEIEYELRVLEIDPENIADKIVKIGGKLMGSFKFRRYVFETNPVVEGRWIRLRTNGEESTLTVKQIKSDLVDGTSEWEVVVDDFDITFKILEKIGIKPKGYQENLRVEYKLDEVTLAIDTWPHIPPYLEIEGPEEKSIVEVAEKLGYKKSDLTGENTQKIYLRYGIDIQKNPDLKFDS